MRTFQTRVHTTSDGVVSLRFPSGISDADLEVTVIVAPAAEEGPPSKTDTTGWQQFIAETGGSIEDPSFMRHDQGQFEERDRLT